MADVVERAMRNLAAQEKTLKAPPVQSVLPLAAEQVLLPREAFFARKKAVPVAMSVGMIAAEPVTFYPPGVPVLLPGERISRSVLEWCLSGKQQGLYLSGPQDGRFETIQVVDEA